MQHYSEEVKLLQQILGKIDNYFLCPEIRENWIPRHELMAFIGLSENQFAFRMKEAQIRTVCIGKQKFYYKKDLLRIFPQN
jgi:hypothetical protein